MSAKLKARHGATPQAAQLTRKGAIKIGLQLEEAIEEVVGESLQGSGFERETPAEEFSEIEPGASELRQSHGQAHRRNAT
jgi:hypothetical protein